MDWKDIVRCLALALDMCAYLRRNTMANSNGKIHSALQRQRKRIQ